MQARRGRISHAGNTNVPKTFPHNNLAITAKLHHVGPCLEPTEAATPDKILSFSKQARVNKTSFKLAPGRERGVERG